MKIKGVAHLEGSRQGRDGEVLDGDEVVGVEGFG